jgi:hypothetical protein
VTAFIVGESRLRPASVPPAVTALRSLLRFLLVDGIIAAGLAGAVPTASADTFQYVCLRPDVTDTWLCVWGRGSTSKGVLNFLRTMNDLPIAAWCDLDARGIEIVTELAGRLGREITPVGMGIELFAGGKQYVPKNLADLLRVARKMTVDGHPALRNLAKAIVTSGGLGCEHETLCNVVPPTLLPRSPENLRSWSSP